MTSENDVAGIVARIGQIKVDDPREIARVGEDAAAALVAAGAQPPFTVTSVDSTDRWLIFARQYWALRLRANPSITIAAACGAWLGSHIEQPDHRHEITQAWALEFGTRTRDTVDSPQDLAVATQQIMKDVDDPHAHLFATLFHASKLRANLWFDELHQFLQSPFATHDHDSGPLVLALRAYGAFGSRRLTTEYATGLLRQAWIAPSRLVTDVCLDALSVAPPFPGQRELLRAHAAEASATFPDDPDIRRRLATGQRMCGDFEAALSTIDAALRLLPVDNTDPVTRRCQRERELIQAGQLHATLMARIQRDSDELEAQRLRVQRRLVNPTSAMLPLWPLAVVTVVLLIAASRMTIVGAPDLRSRVELELTLGAGLLLFSAIPTLILLICRHRCVPGWWLRHADGSDHFTDGRRTGQGRSEPGQP
ncbi:hypothetical protein Ga0074812_14734 [Parafrankia irregularis]|uniref:Tetratricopeptide repeat-containing protein n=1 Tax=Parafrankia irregularis TaxID=795642 RepID=A0A0S4QZV9_9ACTN|nr:MULTISPECIES: hypothetical protein [Parafrankia]MBE3206653.1 hypothetical protein [Parafrankia sp. CH37]CUU60788.1 hypothetical protein Ga0074812_14734 [Parafrankia irregularis]